MTVCVNQAGHQRFAGYVDDIPVNRRTRLSLHRHDAVALDDNNRIIEVLTLHAIEDPCVHECCSIHEPPVCFALTKELI